MKVREIDLNLIFWRMALLFSFCITFFVPESSFSQSYGLGFNGQEFSKDLRTGADLSPKGYFSFKNEFELTFKMLLRPNAKMYFGYIARIIDKQGRNIDLIFNYRSIDSSAIEVVCGQKLTKISFNADIVKLCNRWTEFRLKVDLNKNQVSLFSDVYNYIIDDYGADLIGEVKIIFGMSDFSHFKTADLPSMKIKDICIYEKGKLNYSWPLDETEGDKAYDKIRKQVALIKNPVWLKPEHTEWQKTNSSILSGHCEIAFNEQDEKIYLIGDDQMIIYSVKSSTSEKLIYKEKANILLPGRQAFYNPDTKTIFSSDIDQNMVSEFDFNTAMWKQEVPLKSLATVFLHHNQYYSSSEKSLYIFGGYGQHTYKNLIQRYRIGTGVWDMLKPTGDFFNPRYLAAMGVMNDTAFILGGYGSITGKQIINPQNYSDLMAFSLKDHKFTKVYDFVPPAEDICFSNSMVINPDDRTFYALSFSALKFDGYLQLVKGSLQSPEIKLIASKIPYLFHDVKSFSSLYFCESSKKLIAATMLLNNENQTEINLYSISSPPNETLPVISSVKTIPFRLTYLFVLVAIILAFSFIFRKRFKRRHESNRNDSQNREVAADTIVSVTVSEKKKTYRNSVFFFGGFQVFNSEGTDITCRFSPLLKELFLLIWLNSIKNNKGISSEKINELLWFDKDEKSASNNRAVNIAKLKQIIGEIDTCTLSHKTAYWKIEFDELVVYNDYFECIRVTGTKKPITKEKINKLIDFSLKGDFLMNSNYEWLDEFKANISNTLIDILVELAQKQKIEEDPDFILRLADSIFIFDIVNEEAMILKCRALIFLGKHSLALNTLTKFSKEFEILYDKKYDKTIDEVLNQGVKPAKF